MVSFFAATVTGVANGNECGWVEKNGCKNDINTGFNTCGSEFFYKYLLPAWIVRYILNTHVCVYVCVCLKYQKSHYFHALTIQRARENR